MLYSVALETKVNQYKLKVNRKMPKPRRELKNIAIAAKITSSLNKKLIAKCEAGDISTSEYINRLIKKDLKIK